MGTGGDGTPKVSKLRANLYFPLNSLILPSYFQGQSELEVKQ